MRLPANLFHVESPASRSNSSSSNANSTNTVRPPGHRLVNVELLNEFIAKCCCSSCNSGKLLPDGEKFEGLASSLSYKCDECSSPFTLHTSKRIRINQRGPESNELNVRLVAGTLAAGNGHAQAEQLLTALGSPMLSPGSFQRIQETLASTVEKKRDAALAENIHIEKQAAIELGHLPDADGLYPVVVSFDGWWPKRY